MDDLDEIVHEFLVESHENLDQLDSDLVALEVAPGSRELLGSVFRTIHTIKGTSGFLAFNALEAVTHAGENLLVELRDGRRSMDQPTTTVLLAMVDTVRAILGSIESDGSEGGVDVAPVVDRIQAVLEDRDPPAVPADPGPKVAPKAAPRAGSRKIVARKAPPATPAPRLSEVPSQHRPDHQPEAVVTSPVQPAADTEPSTLATTDPAPSDATTARTAAEGSIRVDVDLLDAMMRQVGELVLARNAISRLAEGNVDIDLVRAAQRLSLIASELQEGVMRTRMQPIEHVWSKVPRMVRDLSATCDKRVRLELVGGDTELDRSLLEAIKDPLTHLIRNAIDHGIEDPQVRVAAGKPAQGLLLLRAFHAGGQVVVEVVDDGKGVRTDQVGAKAIERGLRTADEVAAMVPAELLQMLFLPGFSTAEAVTNVSGRGVGMDVVRTKIEAIGGTVDVESTVGRGTTWRLRIPLTLAIMPALTVECDHQLYAIPQVSLLELVALGPQSSGSIEYVRSAPVYRLRGELLPLVDLREVFASPARPVGGGTVIAVLQADTQRFGLVVDRVLNTEEIVVKPISGRLKAIGLYAGATLLGDGRVSLILDVQAIGRRAMVGEIGDAAREAGARPDAVLVPTVQVLVAAIGGGRRVAIPLSAVTRLEKLPITVLEHVGGREVVQYRGAITPVVRLDQMLGTGAGSGLDGGDQLTVVVYSHGDRSVAIVVEEIIDIVEDDPGRHSNVGDHGLVGSTVLKERVTELLDVRSAVIAADPNFFTGSGHDVGDLVDDELALLGDRDLAGV